MITRFSTLYVGHIELERCGLDGAPADDRRYPNERLLEAFDTAAALAQAADTLGYETLWLAEHHFQHEGYERHARVGDRDAEGRDGRAAHPLRPRGHARLRALTHFARLQ